MKGSIPEQFVVPCTDIDEAIASAAAAGFRLELIIPADDPTTAIVSKNQCFVRLERTARGFSAESILSFLDSDDVEARLSEKRFTKRAFDLDFAPTTKQELVLSRRDDSSSWKRGRAGMLYRDIIPGRLGGSYIGSHIKIPNGGPVSDYVHYHQVGFQTIFCRKGWVKVVYEDQGAPFILNEGDCVLQPPGIRHRVLESSPNLEVIELSSPAIHATFTEHEMSLPNNELNPERFFGTQRFVRFVFDESEWTSFKGFLSKDTGVGSATGGSADVRLIRNEFLSSRRLTHSMDFLFWYVLKGKISIEGFTPLSEDDCVVVPADKDFEITLSDDCELLQISRL